MASVRIIPAVVESRAERRPRSNKKRAAPPDRVQEDRPRPKRKRSIRARKADDTAPMPSPGPTPRRAPNPVAKTLILAEPPAKAPPVSTHDDPSLDVLRPDIAEAILQALAAYDALLNDAPAPTPVGVA